MAVVALAAAGCGRTPVKAYDGPSRPLDQLSVLMGGATGDEMSARSVVEFLVIDGVRRAEGTYVASVLPGRHRIGLRQTLQFGSAKRFQFCALEIATAADCRYTPLPPSTPPSLVAGQGRDFQWNVDLSVNMECSGGVTHLLRIDARCGSADELLGERPPK
jgi:hypothetical protein